MKVLIVEDEPSMVELLRYNLESEGFDVSSAFDGGQDESKPSSRRRAGGRDKERDIRDRSKTEERRTRTRRPEFDDDFDNLDDGDFENLDDFDDDKDLDILDEFEDDFDDDDDEIQ